MKSISVFNNKGGVGKTTLTYHVAHGLSELGYKVLMIDADPQCNLTIYSLGQEQIHDIWAREDQVINEGFEAAKAAMAPADFAALVHDPRSLHYILKPTEEGTGDPEELPPPLALTEDLHIIPGRLTLHHYEEKIAERWAGVYRGDPLSIRTVTKIRELSERYGKTYEYDFVIIDTSPSLGSFNKVIISTVDGFFVPAAPDLFSLYGIRNIGKSLSSWKAEFEVIYQLISAEKRHSFPKNFVSFLGYTIYNAKKYTNQNNTPWNLASAHYQYARQIPDTIKEHIAVNLRAHLDDQLLSAPIGTTAVMHSHNTFPAMAQQYHVPMWQVPNADLEVEHIGTVNGARQRYFDTQAAYHEFCRDLLVRTKLLGQ